MSGDIVRNRMRGEAQRVADGSAEPLMGIVTGYDPTQYAVKVKLMPEGAFPPESGVLETDWVPLAAPVVGSGWGLFTPPSLGDQVHVSFVDGEHGSAVVTGRVFDLTNQPLPADAPSGVPSGEVWLVHKSNNRISFGNDGTVTVKHAASGTTLVMGNAGKVTISGSGGTPLAVKRVDDTPSPWLMA